MKKVSIFPQIIVFFILILFIAIPCFGSQLKHSINKYKNVEVSHRAMKRLMPYNKLINKYAQYTFFRRHHKVSPDFIRALILAESSADPRAVSSKGAMGLGQIMFSTGKEAAIELAKSKFNFPYLNKQKLHHLQKEDLFDPAVNILLTCYLISKYNYKFNGKLELVLSAWNAGEYHKELNKGRPVPYRETHDLIGKVNGYYIDLLQKRRSLSIKSRRR
jgi:soluble lytic murein transglycosylase